MTMRPFVVEFTGTPEAGKTTTIHQLIPLLQASHSIKPGEVHYVRESAEITPDYIPKGSFDANFWMRAHTVEVLLEQIYRCHDNDIIIVDRGIIDAQFFGYKFYFQQLCSEDEYKSFCSLIDNPTLLPDLLVYLRTTPEESIHRRGGEGRVVTLDWVKEYNIISNQFISSLSVPTFSMDTTAIPQSIVIEKIAYKIISNFEAFRKEAF